MNKSYTVNVFGKVTSAVYHTYYSDSITAIEIKAKNKREARKIARQYGKVLFIFE